jgi:hypothetical protein
MATRSMNRSRIPRARGDRRVQRVVRKALPAPLAGAPPSISLTGGVQGACRGLRVCPALLRPARPRSLGGMTLGLRGSRRASRIPHFQGEGHRSQSDLGPQLLFRTTRISGERAGVWQPCRSSAASGRSTSLAPSCCSPPGRIGRPELHSHPGLQSANDRRRQE